MSAFWPIGNIFAEVEELDLSNVGNLITSETISDIDGLIEAQEEVIKIAEEAIFKLGELKKLMK